MALRVVELDVPYFTLGIARGGLDGQLRTPQLDDGVSFPRFQKYQYCKFVYI